LKRSLAKRYEALMMIKKTFEILIALVALLALFTPLYIRNLHLGYELSILQFAKIASVVLVASALGIWLKVSDSFQSIKGGMIMDKIIRNLFLVPILIGAVLIPSVIIIEPLMVISINGFNESKEGERIIPEKISFERSHNWYNYDDNALYLNVTIEKDTFELQINNELKDITLSSNQIKNLRKGRLGFYYIAD
jgi:hypothetical protein